MLFPAAGLLFLHHPFVPPPAGPPAPIVNVIAGDSLATIQSKMNSQAGTNGSLRFPASTTFNLGGNLTLVNGITVWSDGATTITNGDFDASNRSNWTIRGVSSTQLATQGFIFSGTSRITANGASGHWTIGNCTFLNNTLRNGGFDGSAVVYDNCNPNLGADQGLIINCNISGGNGVSIGGSGHATNCNNVTHDGLQFLNCRQPSSLQFPINPFNTAYGNNIVYRRCAFEGTTRACLEFGPNSNGPEYMNGLVCDQCWFGNFNHIPATSDGNMLAISFVALAQVNTTVTNNFIFRGSTNPGIIWPGIEFAGTGTCANNTIVNANWAGFTYSGGWNVHDNNAWFDASNPNFGGTTANDGGWSNNSSPPQSGTFLNNTAHVGLFPGPIPPYPTRIAF